MKKTSFIFILIFSVFFSYQNALSYYDVNNIIFYQQVEAQLVSGTTYCISDTDYDLIQSHGAFPGGGAYATGNSDTSPKFEEVGLTGTGGNTMDCSGGYNFNMSGMSDGTASILECVKNASTSWTTYTGDVKCVYALFSVSGGTPTPTGLVPPPDTQGTYNESPFNGEVVATSGTGDVLVSFDYYLDSEQDPDGNTAEWCMRLVRNDGAGEAEYCDVVVFDTYTEVSHTFTGLALDSQWDWSIIFTRPGFFIDEYSILHAGSNYFWAGRFTVDSTVQEIYTAYTTCSITDLAGCFQNAIVFLFYPSQSSLNDFSNLYDAIKDKPPFGYISAVQTSLQGINDTGTSVFTLETMPILDTYIFTPVRTAIIWILWLAFIFMFYHRLKNIHL
jgi:hypothetical protein